jgi:hypothetical protein
MKLYYNGLLVATNSSAISFSASGNGNFHRLGQMAPPKEAGFHGEMDEIRIWDHERSADEIRNSMCQRLSGKERGLAALWNFDDPSQPGRDSAPHHIDGRLTKGAELVQRDLPDFVYGRILDPEGKPLSGATVDIWREGGEAKRITSDVAGGYAVMMDPSTRYDLFLTTGKLSSYRLGFQPRDHSQKLDWTLSELGSTAGLRPENRGKPSKGSQDSFPVGTVVARTLTDEVGQFDFTQVQPGVYQLRAQVEGGTEWYEAGQLLHARRDLPVAEDRLLRSIEFRLAPPKKGHWTTWNSVNGLPSNEIRKFWVDPEGVLWIATTGGVSRFDGEEFVNLTTEDGLLDDRVYNLGARGERHLVVLHRARGISLRSSAAHEGKNVFRSFTSKDGLAPGQVHAVTQTPDGTMGLARTLEAAACRALMGRNSIRFRRTLSLSLETVIY